MSKRLIIILVLAFVVGIAFTAYAEVQNVKVSGDLAVQGIARSDLTLKKVLSVPASQNPDFGNKVRGFLSQVRVRIDADLTDNVSTTVRLLNERVWGVEKDSTMGNEANGTDIDLDLAYATLKEFLYSPLTLTIGRQNLRFGSGLVVGDPDTNAVAANHGNNTNRVLPNSIDDLSVRKAFDAIRATLNYDPLVVDLIYSRIDENNIAAFDNVDLYGVNASYALRKDLNTELYYFERKRDASSTSAGSVGIARVPSKPEKTRVVGARGAYTGVKDLSLSLEGALQFGNRVLNATLHPNDPAGVKESRNIRAFAIQANADYALPVEKISRLAKLAKYSPMIGGSYTYLSGDKNQPDVSDKRYKGWDPMFEDQNSGTLFNKIFALTNMQIINLNASCKPMEDLTLSANYYYLRLNRAFANSDITSGQTLTYILSDINNDPTYTMRINKPNLGSEIDLGLTYDYTEDVQFALTGGAFIPGGAFDKTNKKTSTQLIGSMKVTF